MILPWNPAFDVPRTICLNSLSLAGSWTLIKMYLNFPLLSMTTSGIAFNLGFLCAPGEQIDDAGTAILLTKTVVKYPEKK